MDKNRHMENNRRKRETKKKINDTKSQRIKNQLQTRYSTLDKEVKRKTKADKRAFIENLADEAETAAQMQNMATLYKITKALAGGFKNILQKRAIRLITLSRYNSHTAPLFKKLKLLTIKDMLALQELKFYYKLTHNELPAYFQNWQIVTNSELHRHNTRRKHDIHIVGFRHAFAKRCIRTGSSKLFGTWAKMSSAIFNRAKSCKCGKHHNMGHWDIIL